MEWDAEETEGYVEECDFGGGTIVDVVVLFVVFFFIFVIVWFGFG